MVIRSMFSNRTAIIISFLSGLVYSISLILFAFVIQEYEFTGEGISLIFIPVWTGVGLFLLAAIPVYLLIQYSLLSPLVIFSLNLTLALRAELSASPGEPLNIQFIAWFIPLGIAVAFGGIEYLIRLYLKLYPPKPLFG
jgi:hypothetical protein